MESLQEKLSPRLLPNTWPIYMADEEIGFNELMHRLNISPTTQASKIQSGEANLTLASVAHICTFLKMKPRLVINGQEKSCIINLDSIGAKFLPAY